MPNKELRYFRLPNGKMPFNEWINDLKDQMTRARINRRLKRLKLGNYGDYKALGDGIYELRFTFGGGCRIYFAEQNEIIVILLCGGNKASQEQDILTAKKYWREFRGLNNG